MDSYKLPASLVEGGNMDYNWKVFKEDYQIYITASEKSKKSKEVQAAIFLNMIGEYGRQLHRNFNMTPEDAKDVIKIIEQFDKFCSPKKNVVYERFRFNQRSQKVGESFDSFLAAIQQLVLTCGYAEEENNALRDRIVIGITDLKVQERLLSTEEVDYEKAVKICRAAEVAREQAKDVQDQKSALRGTGCIDLVSVNKNNFQKKINKFEKGGSKISSQKISKCTKCDRMHGVKNCPAYGKHCNRCGKLNHFGYVCKTKKKPESGTHRPRQVSHVTVSQDFENGCEYDSDPLYIGVIGNSDFKNKWSEHNGNNKSWYENIVVEKSVMKVKIDTGAEVNCINLKEFKRLKGNNNIKVHPTLRSFETYGGGKATAEGMCFLVVERADRKFLQEFYIFDNADVTLLGLQTCELLGFVKRSVSRLDAIIDVQKDKFIRENKDVFDGVGTFGEMCTLKLKDDSNPVIKPVRRVPKALYARLKSQLDEFVEKGIIKPIENEELSWVHNLVVREKSDGKLRICLDPKELNSVLKPEVFPIPRSEEINSQLAGKKFFTVLDCKEGFYHIKLDEASANLCTFNTVFGCYKFLRLPFGLSIAPQLFQKMNTKNFANIKGLIIYIDDLLIAADTEEEHDRLLEQVLQRARELNIKFNEKKVQYKVKEVKYLGHKYTGDGIEIDEGRVAAISDLKDPKNKKELQSILGMINFIREYIPQISEITAPLRDLIKKNVVFKWLPSHSKILFEIKKLISSAPTLGIFDEQKEITIQCDASKNGLGACLMQEGRPIAYASRSLTETEKRYAQIEKELLAIVFSCRKFHFYIYGRKITLHTDHKPLVSIFAKDVSEIPSVRLQNMRLKLLRYRLNLIHIPGKLMHIADLLSRSFSEEHVEYEDEKDIKDVIHSVNMSERSKLEVVEGIETDKALHELRKYCIEGWPLNKKSISENVRVYYNSRKEIYTENGLVFYKDRIIVPTSLREKFLKLVHEGHQGVVKSKLRANSLIYWPGIGNEIENLVANCRTCEKFQRSNRKQNMICHEIPERPFQKIGVDICEYASKSYLIMMDYFSKWLEIVPINYKHSSEIINKFKITFATHGIPEEVIADNVPFSSVELANFAREWKFKITTSSPKYPKSNGLAEKAVHIAKSIIKKSAEDKIDFYVPLLEYRNTPIPSLGFSPSQILMSRMCRAKIPVNSTLLHPKVVKDIKEKLQKNQMKYEKYYNRNAHNRETISPGESVCVQRGKIWETAKVLRKSDTPRSYVVRTTNDQVLRRNMTHLRKSNWDKEKNVETTTMSGFSGEVNSGRRGIERQQPSINGKFSRYGRPIIAPRKYGFMS